MFKLYLDPGHGGKDPGAVGNGLEEKELVLDIALRIRNMLINEYKDVEVKMSRTKDVDKSLTERTNEANAYGADFYLSLHINAFNGSANGYEDYIHDSLSDSSSTATYRAILHEEVTKLNDLRNRGKKKANFHVLRETNMSALLTENGFIDNGSDANKLKSAQWREKVARGHVNGLEKAFNLKKQAEKPIYRVIVDGVQVGAYQEQANILGEVAGHLGSADRIIIEKV
ncbi:N-acetylmuramoyl-L-alanine amidase family protein [Metabacillus sp. HB246100]